MDTSPTGHLADWTVHLLIGHWAYKAKFKFGELIVSLRFFVCGLASQMSTLDV